jgi:predicted nucleic acid-binding protein
VLFDTDLFIWVQRGNIAAARLMEKEEQRFLSLHTYLELLQCAENKQQHEYTKMFLKDFGFQALPLTENIGHRAAVYIEEYSLSHGLRAGDAIVAATAAEHSVTLCTSNAKHFRPIRDLKIKIFKT